jgi:spermidine/putrescine transport system permease protein
MVIPNNAENVDLAHEFINFVCSYEMAYANSSYVGYTSPIAAVMEDLAAEDGDFAGLNAYLPRTGYDLDEVFVYNAETRKVISNLWSKVKIAASNAR